MPFEVINIRQSDKILKRKRMEQDVLHTLSYLEQCLHGTLYKRELTCQVLGEMGWREGNLQSLKGGATSTRVIKSKWPSRETFRPMSMCSKDCFACKWDLTRG
jgi:hypothetical protein